MWHSKGRQIVGVAPDAFYSLSGAYLFGLPITGYYVLALSVALWFVLEYLPIGRYFYAIGANPKAAELNGIPVRRYTIGLAFAASGRLTGFARHVLLASRLRIGQGQCCRARIPAARSRRRVSGIDHRLSRATRVSRRLGHRCREVTILAIGIAGIQQFGASFFVEPLFNGATLLVAIGAHRRLRATQARRSNRRVRLRQRHRNP